MHTFVNHPNNVQVLPTILFFLLTMFKVSVFEVVDGVPEEPAGPVDDVDGGGDGGC